MSLIKTVGPEFKDAIRDMERTTGEEARIHRDAYNVLRNQVQMSKEIEYDVSTAKTVYKDIYGSVPRKPTLPNMDGLTSEEIATAMTYGTHAVQLLEENAKMLLVANTLIAVSPKVQPHRDEIMKALKLVARIRLSTFQMDDKAAKKHMKEAMALPLTRGVMDMPDEDLIRIKDMLKNKKTQQKLINVLNGKALMGGDNDIMDNLIGELVTLQGGEDEECQHLKEGKNLKDKSKSCLSRDDCEWVPANADYVENGVTKQNEKAGFCRKANVEKYEQDINYYLIRWLRLFLFLYLVMSIKIDFDAVSELYNMKGTMGLGNVFVWNNWVIDGVNDLILGQFLETVEQAPKFAGLVTGAGVGGTMLIMAGPVGWAGYLTIAAGAGFTGYLVNEAVSVGQDIVMASDRINLILNVWTMLGYTLIVLLRWAVVSYHKLDDKKENRLTMTKFIQTIIVPASGAYMEYQSQYMKKVVHPVTQIFIWMAMTAFMWFMPLLFQTLLSTAKVAFNLGASAVKRITGLKRETTLLQKKRKQQRQNKKALPDYMRDEINDPQNNNVLNKKQTLAKKTTAPKCRCRTQKGQRCKITARPNSNFCGRHLDCQNEVGDDESKSG